MIGTNNIIGCDEGPTKHFGRKVMKTMVFALVTLIVAVTTSVFAQKQMKDKEKPSEHRFALKELQVFHDVLYPLVHEALPKSDFDRIKRNLGRLLRRATAIQKVKLPMELAGRKEGFEAKSNELVTQLQDLVGMKDAVDDRTLEKAFNEMHETFEQLVEIVR